MAMNEVVIDALARRIQAKELTIEQVPKFYREAVKQVLDEQSNLG